MRASQRLTLAQAFLKDGARDGRDPLPEGRGFGERFALINAINMGIDNDGVKFLLAARNANVSFGKTITLGRQNFFPTPKELQRLFPNFETEQKAADFITDSKGYAEDFFKLLGAEEVVTMDNSDYEGADIVTDLNAPIDPSLRNRFSAVVDGGCLEHIFNFPRAIQNCMEMLDVGGHFIGIAPANNFCGHGFYQFSPELFFRIFSTNNGFAVRAMLTKEKSSWYRIADPAAAGERVELQNTQPAYLFILAQKIATKDLLTHPPQQSDYAQRWKEKEEGPGFSNQSPVRRRLRDLVPFQWKDRLRPFYVNLPIRFRSKHYLKIEEERLLSGLFG